MSTPPRPRAILGALAAMLLVACTAQTIPEVTTSPPVGADAERDINPLPRDRVREGGLLRFPISHLPTQWNPRHPDADADTQRVLAPLTPAHFTLDAAGRPTPNPDFISDVHASHTDHTLVTLILNERAVWGDATPITADDWIATWRAASGQVDGIPPDATGGWDRVAEVRQGETPTTVLLTFEHVDPDWIQPLVAGPQRAADLTGAPAFSWSSYVDARHASPFMVTHVDRVQGLVTLERNPLWWGDPPKLERIMFRTVPGEALAAAFQHNELDVWETGASSDRLAQSRVAADTAIRSAPGTSGRSLLVSRSGALDDARVRRALLLALDRTEVGRAEVPVGAEPPRTWSNPLLLPTQPGYADQGRATGLTHDPVRAGTLLDEAGWVLEGGQRMKDGLPLVVSFLVSPGDARSPGEARDLAGQLDAVGITLRNAIKDADLTPVSVRVSAFPLARLPEGAAATPGASELMQEVGTEVDPIRRADQASQLARLLWQDVVSIPLYQEPEFVAVRTGLANFGAHAFATVEWEDVGWTS